MAEPSTRAHNRVTPEGRAMGDQLVRLTEPTIQRLAAEGEPDERCKSCAFRPGAVPNGCLQTQMDALKCVVEDVPFLCHQTNRKNWPCHGWYAARVAINRAEKARGKPVELAKCPWEFSPPDDDSASGAQEGAHG